MSKLRFREPWERTDTPTNLTSRRLKRVVHRLLPPSKVANTALEPIGEKAAVLRLVESSRSDSWEALTDGLDALVVTAIQDCFVAS